MNSSLTRVCCCCCQVAYGSDEGAVALLQRVAGDFSTDPELPIVLLNVAVLLRRLALPKQAVAVVR